MAGRPSIQFYFSDWRANQKLRFCSWGARGVWIEVMGLMHDSTEYGVLRKSLKDIAQALGAPMKLLNELVAQGVMYGCATGTCEPMVYRPRHGRVEGDPVLLIEAQEGPIWYSPRMVRDEYVRTKRGESSRFGEDHMAAPKGGIGAAPSGRKEPPKGDGASNSSSSSSSSSEIGNSSTSARVEESAGALTGMGLDDDRVADVMGRCIHAATALRRMGMRDAHMANPALAEIVARGATTEQLVLVGAELALKKAGFLHDPDLHPDLVILVANARSAQEMGLSPAKYAELRKAMPNIGYVCSTLAGRAADGAMKLGDAHGNSNGTRGAAAAAAGGRAHRDSAAGRAEAARRAGDAREEDHDPGY